MNEEKILIQKISEIISGYHRDLNYRKLKLFIIRFCFLDVL